MPRTLIFGGRGQLGRDLERVFAAQGDVKAVDLPELDIMVEGAAADLVRAFHPDLVVNAAAYTDVGKAADEGEGTR